MEAVIKKWGNSLGIRIPSQIAKSMNFTNGSFVELKNIDNGILITTKQKISLSDMLNQITEQNIHTEVEGGQPVGNETW